MLRITSRQNNIISQYRSVANGDDENLLLLDGIHLVSDALAAGITLRHVMVVADAVSTPEIAPLLEQVAARQIDVAAATAQVMSAASPVRSTSPIVALAERPALEVKMFAVPRPLILVACDVQDPGNLGAIARVAEAAAVSGLVVTGQSADPFGWKALRGSMGSALRFPIARRGTEEAIAEARRHGCRILATAPRGGTSLCDVDLEKSVAVLIGGEGHGLPGDILASADERVTIPMRPPVESLNAAVTAALIAYEAHRQRA